MSEGYKGAGNSIQVNRLIERSGRGDKKAKNVLATIAGFAMRILLVGQLFGTGVLRK